MNKAKKVKYGEYLEGSNGNTYSNTKVMKIVEIVFAVLLICFYFPYERAENNFTPPK